MAEFGTPLLADDVLRLSGIAQGYTNERMGRANALRGLTGLRSISGPSTGIDASLRSLSTARDDEITNALFADIVAETTTATTGEELPIISQKQFESKFRKKYPQYIDRYLSDTLKLWSSYRGQEQKEQERTEDINKASAERVAARDFDEFQKEWNASDQTNATFNKLVTKYISKTSKPGRDPAAVAYLKGLITASYGTRGERASAVTRKDKLALDDATQYVIDTTISGVEGGMSASGAYSNAVSSVRSGVVSGKYDDQEAVRRLKALGYNVVPLTKKEQVALDKSRVDLKITKGEYYASGEEARDKVADKYEPYNIPDYQNMTIPEQYKLLQRAKEELISELTGLNITPAQRDQLQDELVDRLSHLEGRKDMSPKEKFIRDLYYLVDESGKSKRRKRLDKNIAKRLLIEKYKFDPEMMALSPAWADMAEEIAEGAIEGMRYEMGLDSAIVRISGSGKHEEDRLIINREPNSKEARTLINEGIIFLVTIDGELLDLQRVE